MSKPRIVIVGGGPAGMVLAYQLASHGVEVQVLEQHPDFDRELRGELIGPLVLPVLERLGVMERLVARGLARTGVRRRMYVGHTREVVLPGGTESGALISQPGLLGLLDELCQATNDGAHGPPGLNYSIAFGTAVQQAIVADGRVVGVEVRQRGEVRRIDADLVIACSGRGTKLRRGVGVETELAEQPDDTLWIRVDLSGAPEALPTDTHVHMLGGGVVVVYFATARSRLQIAYSAPGELATLRKDPAALRAALLPKLPAKLRELVAARLHGDVETQLLKVSIDRLKRWSVPGMLFLGDAAHTMGPAAAQGLNLAIRDAIVAADALIEAGGAIDEAVLARIEAVRRPEIEAAQAQQLRAYRMVGKPLFVQHMMFSMLGLMMKIKKFERPAAEVIVPRHMLPVGPDGP